MNAKGMKWSVLVFYGRLSASSKCSNVGKIDFCALDAVSIDAVHRNNGEKSDDHNISSSHTNCSQGRHKLGRHKLNLFYSRWASLSPSLTRGSLTGLDNRVYRPAKVVDAFPFTAFLLLYCQLISDCESN